MSAAAATMAFSVITGLVALVFRDAMRRIANVEESLVEADLCDERHRGLDSRLAEIREDLGRIYGSIESVRLELGLINRGIDDGVDHD